MACRESRVGVVLLCIGLLVFVTSLCHCTKPTRLKALDNLKESSMHIQSQAKESHQHHGRLLIGQNLQQDAKLNGTNTTNMFNIETDYQADMGWWQSKELSGQDGKQEPGVAATQHVLKMDPRVECTGDSMKLLVQGATSPPDSLLFVDRGVQLSPLSMSKLPSSCGYTIRSTRTDLLLIAPYDGCFVILEENNYVLPLLWWGLPVRMSCPMITHPSPNPPMVTCHAGGMVVKIDGTNSASKIKVKVNGNWEPLLKASQRCIFGVVEHPEGVVISVHYTPCLQKKDGLYTLELAMEGQTKVSCPLLLLAQSEVTKGYQQQMEMPRKGLYSTTSDATSVHPTKPSAHQVPEFPKYPQIPNRQSQVPKETGYSRFPYSPFFPNYLYPHHTNPDSLPTVKPMSPTTASPGGKPTGKNEQGLNRFHSLSSLPGPLPSQSPFTKFPAGKDQHFHQNPSNRPPGLPQKPSANQPKDQEQRPLQPFLYCMQPPASHGHNVHPLCFDRLPENPDLLHPAFSENPHGDLYQPFYLFYTQQHMGSKPPGVSQPSKPGLPQTQVHQPFSTQHSSQNPTVTSQTPWPGVPQGQGHQLFYPFYSHPKPTPKPASDPRPSKPETPKPLNPFYNRPNPTPKPTVSLPLNPGIPRVQEYQPFIPFFNRPKLSWPSEPGTHLRPAQQPLPHPQNPGPQHPSKPTADPQQRLPQSALGQLYHMFHTYHTFPKPQPGTKPPGVPQPSQPEIPQKPSHPQPKPGMQTPAKPSAPQLVQTPAHLDQFHQQMCLYSQLMANHPTAGENIQGQAYGPCYPYMTQGPKKEYGTRLKNPGQSFQSHNVKPFQTNPSNVFSYSQQPPYFPPIPASTGHPPVSTPAKNQKHPGPPNLQMGNVGIPSKVPQASSPQMSSLYCPQICPSGFGNCCLQISFHQHLHIVPAGFDGKEFEFHTGLPFDSSIMYNNFGNGMEPASLSRKPTEGTLQAVTSRTSVPTSPQLPPVADKKHPQQPPDGNPAAPPGSSPSNTANLQMPVNPYFQTDMHLPHFLYKPQYHDLLMFQQGKSPADADPSKLWASGHKPAIQYDPSKIQFPQTVNQPFSGINPYRPSSKSNQYPRHTTEQQSKPLDNERQALNAKFGDQHQINFFSPYYMPRDAPEPTDNNSVAPNNSQESEAGLNSTEHGQTLSSHLESQSYVLLQYGPPGRDHNSYRESPVPLSELAQTAKSETLNLARPHHTNPQNLESIQEKGQQITWLGEGISVPLPSNVNYLHRLDDSSLPSFSTAPDESHRLFSEESFRAVHSKPETHKPFEDLLKSLTPPGSNQKFPLHIPGTVLQEWHSDQPAKGKNKPVQMEHGNKG